MPERRNPVVRSAAILRKGGAHVKSVSGQRQRTRLAVEDALDEWQMQQAEDTYNTAQDTEDGEGPPSSDGFWLTTACIAEVCLAAARHAQR